MKYTTLITATSAVLIFMIFIGTNIWKSTLTTHRNSNPDLITKTIEIPRYNLGGSRKASRPPFKVTMIVPIVTQNSTIKLTKH
jgi:hypothetical protein